MIDTQNIAPLLTLGEARTLRGLVDLMVDGVITLNEFVLTREYPKTSVFPALIEVARKQKVSPSDLGALADLAIRQKNAQRYVHHWTSRHPLFQ